MGRRLVSVAVAGVLAFGGAVAMAGPAQAVPVVRTVAGVPGVPVPAHVVVGSHHVTEVASSRYKRKKRSVVGRAFGWAVGRVFGFFMILLLVTALIVVLVVVSRRKRT
ncbi:hypothetical protein F7Q99_09690 [Streptomyces kaniharaensis]|uniref:Uncharacterized protein n=1 Tax=Streptomyces kaniharaensis TaxID=212423 RepID=A0A6N7KLZ2_9ACTN|nr:hypothetical protein [Streptomyces kaniharaensis]MQS12550.1 hypothetical protein [Streptomyces kaniharaensis]